MGNVKIRKMVQGAMIAAIFGALSIFNTYTGSCLIYLFVMLWLYLLSGIAIIFLTG